VFSPGYDGFCDFAAAVDFDLADFQRKIARTVLGDQAESLVLVPRGHGKSRLGGTLAVHHLLTEPKAAIYVAAASREQASIIYAYAREVALHPALADAGLVVRHLELRARDGGFLKVLASDAPRLHGLTPSLCLVDELHAFRDAQVYIALRTALLKRPGAKLWTLSTAGQGEDSPLGQLRARGLAQGTVNQDGALTTATGEGFAMLEWAIPTGEEVNAETAKLANPAPWIDLKGLRSQFDALPLGEFARYHGGRWSQRAGAFLPEGALDAVIGTPHFEPGEPIWVGCDVGGTEAATAVAWVNQAGSVGVWIETAEDAVLRAAEKVRQLRRAFRIEEFIFDPWRANQIALELERDGVRAVQFPQSDVRMVPASAALRAAIVEKRLTLPDDPELRRHFANAVAQHSRRGWRIASPGRGIQIDAVIALCMASERREYEPTGDFKVIAWV
jgi:phage terminase large subunit-like protein